MIEPFEYLNYRKLLKDLYDERKAVNSNFSYRFIAQKVGFASAGFFTRKVILSRKTLEHITFEGRRHYLARS